MGRRLKQISRSKRGTNSIQIDPIHKMYSTHNASLDMNHELLMDPGDKKSFEFKFSTSKFFICFSSLLTVRLALWQILCQHIFYYSQYELTSPLFWKHIYGVQYGLIIQRFQWNIKMKMTKSSVWFIKILILAKNMVFSPWGFDDWWKH